MKAGLRQSLSLKTEARVWEGGSGLPTPAYDAAKCQCWGWRVGAQTQALTVFRQLFRGGTDVGTCVSWVPGETQTFQRRELAKQADAGPRAGTLAPAWCQCRHWAGAG